MTQEYNVEKALKVSDCFMKMYRRETADIYWEVMLTPEMYTHTHLMALCLTPFLPPNQQRRSTEGIKLPDVQCTENWLTYKNYIANYKIFQEHQLNSRKFPGEISNSRSSRHHDWPSVL